MKTQSNKPQGVVSFGNTLYFLVPSLLLVNIITYSTVYNPLAHKHKCC